MSILSKIVMLKEIYYQEEDQQKQEKLEKDILALESSAIQHDFALLELN